MITLFDNWVIDVDSSCYTLKRVVNGKNKKGEDVTRDDIRGYYNSLEGTLRALGKEIVRDRLKDGSHSLTEAINTVVEARETIEKLIIEKVGI